MFILDFMGNIRTVLFTIDQVAYSLIDDVYNLITDFASAEIFNQSAVSTIMKSTYVIIGFFALFKIALLLVNAIISPDKLFEKESGMGAIVRNVFIMFALLIFVPMLFKESRTIQSTIVKNNYINQIFGLPTGSNIDPGNMFKKSAISALVYPDSRLAKKEDGKYVPIDSVCKDNSTHCKDAVEDYNKVVISGTSDSQNHMFSTLIGHMGDYVKDVDGADKVYVYDYTMLITFIVGIAITYLLILFCFDIAERTIKLAILEIISPLFIVTYIDPKSSKAGPFKNWLKEVGSTYASLFIRLAALALIIILCSLWNQKTIDFSPMGNIIFILSILIFAKQFPKWLFGLIGMSDSGGFSGLKKRLASAALVGGLLNKGMNAATAGAVGAAKTVAANRRNRNAVRRKIREDEGLTHGKKGRDFRKKASDAAGGGVKGYFAGRHALHEARKTAYKNKNASLTGKDAGKNLAQIGASLVGGAITGGKAGLNANDLKASIKAGGQAANQFASERNFGGSNIKNFLAGKANKITGSVNEYAWGTNAADTKDEMKKRDNYNSMYKGNYAKNVGFKDAITSNGGFMKAFQGSNGGFDAVKAAMAVKATPEFAKGKISTLSDGSIQLNGTDANGNAITATIDGASGTATVNGVTKNVSDLSKEFDSSLTAFGQANLENMYNKMVEQSISTQISNNAQMSALMQQRNAMEQSMQYNATLANTSNAQMGTSLSDAQSIVASATSVALTDNIIVDGTGRTVKLADASMDELKYFLDSSSASADDKSKFDSKKAEYDDAKTNRDNAVTSYNNSSSQVTTINNQIGSYQASNEKVNTTVDEFNRKQGGNNTLEELLRDAQENTKKSETNVKALKDNSKDKKE